MANLPPTMNFADAEENIVKKWKDEDTFKVQDKLALERGDEVSGAKAYIVTFASKKGVWLRFCQLVIVGSILSLSIAV